MSKVDVMIEVIKRYAEKSMGKENAKIVEVCDFGNKYGFLFNVKNKYDNAYWCVDKKNYKITMFTPNTNIKMFMKRKIISESGVE